MPFFKVPRSSDRFEQYPGFPSLALFRSSELRQFSNFFTVSAKHKNQPNDDGWLLAVLGGEKPKDQDCLSLLNLLKLSHVWRSDSMKKCNTTTEGMQLFVTKSAQDPEEWSRSRSSLTKLDVRRESPVDRAV